MASSCQFPLPPAHQAPLMRNDTQRGNTERSYPCAWKKLGIVRIMAVPATREVQSKRYVAVIYTGQQP
jgi:hypothetical protein